MDINQVTKKYGNKKVVSDVDYQVKKGKLTAFIGPNGAGKSTLLSMMSRLIEKDQGGIYLDGTEVKAWNQQELAKKLSILKQANGVQLKLTVRELVAFGRFPHSKGRLTELDQEKITKALTFLGLLDLAESTIDTLSGGQLQRAYIAMVLAQDTDYIFLDEPLNNLDMNHAVQLMKTIRQLVDEKGKTVIIVLHDINFAASYADEIVAMKDGKIFKTGTTDEIIEKEVLDELYDMSIRVCELEGKRFCLYFN
ncbi:ABC transporter ATP-binding protein [Vagococcus fluvialis]|uniref:iron ABC transporter ATP-binding protein n=1 Tax=Vagococcus fluvialis TaxID=2738 RepID=UPI0014329FD0|nr:ATP-binding cassette domain-containing protein [Vagococcus fluvialis]MBO0486406.1 ATP-binding cassette domain-containing protein [Vagococcus fluvialis]MCM2139386.1 ATP-binding cassette domain-containing protein [Vagococcus fluvialis]NKC60524.1 ATP-binding cassette domain-containing protein [Vagococcus fluvialis]NKD51307.1 ATP-binding cassette domain-containing protein [Vagococcus fluvialis]UDM71004.1 ATP-binding cassette domain-containing protein [Vagococcus fluvialis]